MIDNVMFMGVAILVIVALLAAVILALIVHGGWLIKKFLCKSRIAG